MIPFLNLIVHSTIFSLIIPEYASNLTFSEGEGLTEALEKFGQEFANAAEPPMYHIPAPPHPHSVPYPQHMPPHIPPHHYPSHHPYPPHHPSFSLPHDDQHYHTGLYGDMVNPPPLMSHPPLPPPTEQPPLPPSAPPFLPPQPPVPVDNPPSPEDGRMSSHNTKYRTDSDEDTGHRWVLLKIFYQISLMLSYTVFLLH